MADGGLPALQPPPVAAPALPIQSSVPPIQSVVPPAQPISRQPIQPPHIPILNWSHFKPEFAGKPDEDVEAHLLRTKDWMDTHPFQEGVRIQAFCLTLVREARLWYESLGPINVDWNALQNQFRQQYSKIGNTRDQLLHVWGSFHFDESTEMLDSYVTLIRQVATLLGYGKMQVLEVFQSTPHMRLLGTPSYRRIKTSSENSKENIDKRKGRQKIGRSVVLNTTYEYKRWVQQ